MTTGFLEDDIARVAREEAEEKAKKEAAATRDKAEKEDIAEAKETRRLRFYLVVSILLTIPVSVVITWLIWGWP